jgi:general secretion pathway protein B
VRKSSPPKREGAPPVAARATGQTRQVQPAPAATPAAAAPVPVPSVQPSPAPMPAPTAAPPKVDRPPSTEPLPSARVPALAELPGDLRQQVPALAIGGSVYSPQASARIVVVNGQVFQEGSALTPELKLEQIRQKSAVFSIRGTRFEVPL